MVWWISLESRNSVNSLDRNSPALSVCRVSSTGVVASSAVHIAIFLTRLHFAPLLARSASSRRAAEDFVDRLEFATLWTMPRRAHSARRQPAEVSGAHERCPP